MWFLWQPSRLRRLVFLRGIPASSAPTTGLRWGWRCPFQQCPGQNREPVQTWMGMCVQGSDLPMGRCRYCLLSQGRGRKGYRYGKGVKEISKPYFAASASKARTPSGTTSLPMPSPGIRAIWCAITTRWYKLPQIFQSFNAVFLYHIIGYLEAQAWFLGRHISGCWMFAASARR